jgi:hypothetical protein
MESPLVTIHEFKPGLLDLSREATEEYLRGVAEALVNGWGDELETICDEPRARRSDEVRALVKDILKEFKAGESVDGIMKNAVFVNHQWVIKLGHNAITEAQEYEDYADNAYQDVMVPTVWLGDYGCLALKVETPKIRDDYYAFDNDEHEEMYQEFKTDCGVPDMHRGNCGIWQGRMVAIDWGGGA